MLDADLLILTVDGSLPLDAGDLHLIEEFRERSPLIVLTKSDLPEAIDHSSLLRSCAGLPLLRLSTLDSCGCPELARIIAERCRESAGSVEGTAPNLRHQEALRTAADSLGRATGLISHGDALLDQAVAELHRAVTALGEITGETAGEAILERVFSRFCIGK
jgi:tRNA modification GTPase